MMSFNSALLNLDQLYLEIPASSLTTRSYSTAGGNNRAHLNQLALAAFLPWLQAEHSAHARVWGNAAALPSFWEFVNGTAIEFDGSRLVLLPSEAIDTDELRVPQEWLDIPAWAADYYIGVQVNADEGWIRVWGYTTHHRLKTSGTYDAADRAYSLPADAVFSDLNVLWIARELCPDETLKAEMVPLPAMSTAQAINLLDRLGTPELALPRQAVPFPLWGALLEHAGWRQQLCDRRQGLAEQWSIAQWVQAGVSSVAQQIGWSLAEPQLAAGFRSLTDSRLLRQLEIAGNVYELEVSPLPDRATPTATAWRFELRNPTGSIPAGFTLRLLTEDLQPFENNEDSATAAVDCLYVDVMVEPGEALVWEIDPLPTGCDREILRF